MYAYSYLGNSVAARAVETEFSFYPFSKTEIMVLMDLSYSCGYLSPNKSREELEALEMLNSPILVTRVRLIARN